MNLGKESDSSECPFIESLSCGEVTSVKVGPKEGGDLNVISFVVSSVTAVPRATRRIIRFGAMN